MDFFEKNRRSIEKTAPHLIKTLASLPPAPPAESAESGDPTVTIDDVRLASSVDPVSEGEKFATAQSDASGGLLVYGLGLGYHLEAVLKLYPELRVTVIEANRDILSAALHHRDLTALFSDARFSLVAGRGDAELAGNFIKSVRGAADEWKIAVHTPSYRCFPHGFDRVKNSFETLLSERRFKERFAQQERKNIRANLPAVSRSAGVFTIYGKLRGRPAVLVGAGPSLDRNLALLDWLQYNAFILAADTATETLTDAGITCHATLSIDPQPASAMHFRDGPPDAPLIFFPTTHPWVVERHEGNRLLAIKQSHSLFKKAEKLLQDRGVTKAGGSVSCMGLDLLVQGGADPIGIVGQDFAFPEGLPYNRRTFAAIAHGTPVRGESAFARDALDRHENLKIESVDGRDTVTHANLLSYLRTFEEIIAGSPEGRFFNLDSSGAAIRGCRNLSCAGEVSLFFRPAASKPEPLEIPGEKPRPELLNRISELLFGR
jgi:hypothetical protein